MRTLMLLTLCLLLAAPPAMALGGLSTPAAPAPRDDVEELLCLANGGCPVCPPFLNYPCLPP